MTYASDSTTIDADIAPRLRELHSERYLHLDSNGRKYLKASGSANNSDLAGTHCVATVVELPRGIRSLNSSTILSKYTISIKGSEEGVSTLDCFEVPVGQYAIRVQHDNTPLLTLGNNPLSVTAGSPIMTIDYGATPHGLSQGNNVVIAGASTFASLSSGTLNRRHNVTSVVSPTVLTVTLDTNAGGTGVQAGGGAVVTALSNLTGNETSFVTFNLGNNPLSIGNGSSTLTITFAAAHGLVAGSDIQLVNAPSVGNIATSVLNTYHRIVATPTTTTVTVTLPVSATADALGSGGTGIVARGNFLERFRQFIRSSIKGVRLVGSGRRGSHGIILGNDQLAGNGDNRSTRGVCLVDTEVYGFDIGIDRGPRDSYLQANYNVSINACRVGINGYNVNAPTGTTSNRGERMSWFNTTVYDTEDYMIRYPSRGLNDDFVGLSTDFSEKGYFYFSQNAGYQTINVLNGWFESHDDIPFRSDLPSEGRDHTILAIANSFWLPRLKTIPNWSWYNGSLSVTGGARAPLATGFQTLRLDGLVITNEARFSDPAGLFLADEDVRIVNGNVIFSGFQSGFTQQLIAESLVRNYNHDFAANNSGTPTAWAVDTGVAGQNVTFAALAFSPVTLGTSPISTLNGSMDVTITHSTHGLRVGDKIVIANVPADIGGVPVANFNRRHIVRSVIDANTYTIKVPVIATSTASGGGTSVTTVQRANVMTATAGAGGAYGVILSDFFAVSPGEMYNANFKVHTASGSTGLCNVGLSYLWYTQGDVLITDANDRLVVASNAQSVTALGGTEADTADGMYARRFDPAFTAGSRARPVMGLGCYRQAPRHAAKARLRFECNNFANSDVVQFALVATNRMST